ncbi:Gag-Pol polyprotein [Gossypium arboreum]|uniref:Gag-Pol polyprotein n=1 Tax=Gossypium arboreum TaxID=29729 RepID=A0A0B0MA20_GOSAR|nr:Gag-Pol polyprotein [Gossypium arboreum]
MPGRPKKNKRMAKDEPKKLKPGHSSRKGLLMTCTQCGQHGHNKRSSQIRNRYSVQDAQPPKQKGKSFIKRSTTLDKSKGNLLFFASSRTTSSMTTVSCQYGTGQTSSTPKSRNNKRKAPLDYLGTQESVAGNTRPSRDSS